MHDVKHFELEVEPTRLSLVGNAADLEAVFEASPALAALLPDLMRRMADEIEMISDSRATHDANRLERPYSTATESLARRVTSQISIMLSSWLTLGHVDDAAGLRSSVRRETLVASLQPSMPGIRDQASQPQLNLKLLGCPEITLDGVRLTPVEHCSRAAIILYMLALHRGGLSGQRMISYLVSEWEDMDALDERAILSPSAHRTYIWRLRKLAGWRDIVIAHCEQGGRQNRYLLPDNTACDIWKFEDNLDQAARLVVRANIAPDAVDQAATFRQEAILLYGGDFCQGIGAGAIARAADYLRHRYLQAVMSQAAYWKDKALKLCDARQLEGTRRDLPIEEENAWLEALKNYRLAVHIEPYEKSADGGLLLCQAHLGNL